MTALALAPCWAFAWGGEKAGRNNRARGTKILDAVRTGMLPPSSARGWKSESALLSRLEVGAKAVVRLIQRRNEKLPEYRYYERGDRSLA